MTGAPVPARASPALPLRTHLWLGLVTAGLELLVLAARKYGGGAVLHLSRDVVWMVPLSYAVLFVVLGGGTQLVLRWHRLGRHAALALTLFLGALALLQGIPGLHLGAAVVLATGLAVQGVRLWTRRADAVNRQVRRSLPVLLAVTALAGATRAGVDRWRARTTVPAAQGPNILLLVFDTVRRQSLSTYGYARPTSPVLARLAAEGVAFDQAYTVAPWTTPSHAALFTGLWPHQSGADWTTPLRPDVPTLAELLARRGYRTGGFAANSPYVNWEYGLDRGFATFSDYPRSLGEVVYSSALGRVVSESRLLRRRLQWYDVLGRRQARTINAEALAWMDAEPDRPFFVFLNYFDAHAPYLPPAPYDTLFGPTRGRDQSSLLHWGHQAGHPDIASLSPAALALEQAAYDGGIAYMDHALGELLAALEARGQLANTIVIVTADHGEQWGERGYYSHGNSLYPPAVEVPLVIWGPGRLPAGRRVPFPVSLRNVPATALALTDPAAPALLPGRSLAEFWGPDASQVPPDTVLLELSDDGSAGLRHPQLRRGVRAVVSSEGEFIRYGDGSEELLLAADSGRGPSRLGDTSAAASVGPLRAQLEAIGPFPLPVSAP